ncbi:MAG: 4-hydroxythreonine-4-phosphate dehydrogenase PdxA [Dehalococcoidia bacterium]
MGTDRPLIAVTIGDPAGVGPEIVLGALADPSLYAVCRPLVIGDRFVLERVAPVLRHQAHLQTVDRPADGRYEAGIIDLLDMATPEIEHLQMGVVQPEAGRAAFGYIKRAIELTQAGEVDAIATAPINKDALRRGAVPFLDHTNMLGALTNSPNPMTMFTVENLRIFFATRHVSLAAAAGQITKGLVTEQLVAADQALKQYGWPQARIAVAALNPHNGEDGMFGDTEITELRPAVEEACRRGVNASGPFAADSIFQRMREGGCDAVLSLYHDQGHIAAKSVDFYRTIALTPGLPFVRSSVDHGTAFDIAGKGIANPTSMAEAIRIAAEYHHRFQQAAGRGEAS